MCGLTNSVYRILLLVAIMLCLTTEAQRIYPKTSTLKRVKIPANIPRPKYRKPVLDKVFKTTVTRIADVAAFKSKRKKIRHGYSKKQSFNCDGTRIMLANQYLIDGNTYKLVGTYSSPSSECLWSNKNPNIMYAFDPRTFQFITIDVRNGKRETLHKFKGYEKMYMGRWEGNLSIDDKYVAFMGKKGPDLYIITFDISIKKIVAVKKFPGKWKKKKSPEIDWVSFSQSGEYVLINWERSGEKRYCGMEVYDKKMNFLRQLTERGEHGDIGYDTSGDEVFVQVTCGARGKYKAEIISTRLKDGKLTRVLDSSTGGFGGHVSCRNTKRPGWAYVSTYSPHFEVFAVKLDGSQQVQRFAHTHSARNSYNAEPQAVPNHYGDKVVFASNWDGESEIYSYIVSQLALVEMKNQK